MTAFYLTPDSTSAMAPASTIKLITTSDTDDIPLGGPTGTAVCRCIVASAAAMIADIIDGQGNFVSQFAFQQGYNPVSIRRIKTTNLSNTNSGVFWALY